MERCDGCRKRRGYAPADCWDFHLCDVKMPTTPIKPKAYSESTRYVWETQMFGLYGEAAPIQAPRPRVGYTDELLEEVRKVYIDQGLTAHETAVKLGLTSAKAVHQLAGRMGWVKPPKGYKPELVAAVLAGRSEGLEMKAVAARTGATVDQVRRIVRLNREATGVS